MSNRIPVVRTVAFAREVARLIERGDQVMTLFRASKWALPVPGARLMRTLDTSHGEWIATEEPGNHAGRTLEDLPSF